MLGNASMMSPADIAALTGNNDGFGNGNGAWWLIIFILFFAFGGWGNGGWGGNSQGAAENYVLASDFATLQRQIDSGFTNTNGMIVNSADQLQRQVTSIANGISSLGYDQLSQFNGVNTNVLTQSNAIGSQIADLGYSMQNCCCQTQRAIDGVNYNMATNTNTLNQAITNGFCQTNYNASNNTRDIVDAQNLNTRAILDKLCQMESNAKDDRIAELTAMNSDLRLAASQQAQNNYLVSQLGTKTPIPAYVVANPYCNCACNTGCGCQ